MATLSSSIRLGTTSATSLIKSAQTLENEVNTYNDTIQRIQYENSGHTDAAYKEYSSYLQGRIKVLKSTSSITNATKAANMEQTLISAEHSNISFHIQQENIALMAQGDAGTAAGYRSKMDVLAGQFGRAMAIGDTTLAETLQSQYYSASQSYQNAVQTAASAATTAAKAATTLNVTNEKDIIGALHSALDQLNSNTQTLGFNKMDSTVQAWVKQNSPALEALGVKLPSGAQPNYWNVVNGVMGALYNANSTLSSLYSDSNPYESMHYKTLAQNLMDGSTKISTLGGDMTAAQVAQAESDPNMFVRDFTTGKYVRAQQTGYDITPSGAFKGSVEASYTTATGAGSGVEKTTFLSPYQTNIMNNMHLQFAETSSAAKTTQAGTVDKALGISGNEKNPQGSMVAANGVRVEVTDQSPQWLRNIIGDGTVNMYLDQKVPGQFLEFGHAGDPNGYYIVGIDGRGLTGGFRVMADANNPGGVAVQALGGDYGFNQNSVFNVINNALNNHFQVAQAQADTVKLQSAPIPTPHLVAATHPTIATPHTPQMASVPHTTAVGAGAVQHAASGNIVQHAGGGTGLNTGGQSAGTLTGIL